MKLYHATYFPNLKNIILFGINGQKEFSPNWEDSKKVVYLASDPEISVDFAITSNIAWEKYSQEKEGENELLIILLEIDSTNLDSSNLWLDPNIRDNQGESWIYDGVIKDFILFRISI